tara:strand:- start:1275 stop:1475 length:201 start_codon:yes stop_codon:yes gene_type:complete
MKKYKRTGRYYFKWTGWLIPRVTMVVETVRYHPVGGLLHKWRGATEVEKSVIGLFDTIRTDEDLKE